MKPKRIANIRIETYEVTTVRRRPSSLRVWCAACAAEVEMFSSKRAAEWAAVHSITISIWVEARKLHVVEMTPGWIFVCRNSLERQVKQDVATKSLKIHAQAGPRFNARPNITNSKGELP